MSPPIPTVTITVQDQGGQAALVVPLSTVQLKVGVAIGGTVNVPIASSSPQSLQTSLVGGPLLEAAGLVAQVGNVVVAIPIPIVTHGTATAITATVPGGSTSTVTTTLDGTNGAWDTYYIRVRCLTGGTIGTAGIVVQCSGDAGRNWGAPVALGTAVALVLGAPYSPATVGATGIQVNFGAGTLIAGDYWSFSTVGPAGNAAGIAAGLAAFQSSQYGVAGVGSVHVVGDMMHGGSATDDIPTVQTQLQAGVALYEFQRAIVELRDALVPVAWGGAGETEATWIAALQTATSGLNAHPRVCADGGNYNIQSAYANAAFGTPQYRRPGAWAHAVIRTQIKLEQRAGRVKNANQPYSQIDVNPATDPKDGFVYHDERVTPGLAAGRISCMMTWPKKGLGFFHCVEPLLSAPGSQLSELAIGNVIDAACDIAYAQGIESVSDDLVTQQNGTLATEDLNILQNDVQGALNEGLVQPSYISSVTATVSPTQNVEATGLVPISVAVFRKGYVDGIVETIFLATGGGGG
jgi:hypothetical protein